MFKREHPTVILILYTYDIIINRHVCTPKPMSQCRSRRLVALQVVGNWYNFNSTKQDNSYFIAKVDVQFMKCEKL